MTQETPPGWYPDPGQTSDGPATERWWDGKTWTQQTRPVGPAAWGPPAYAPAAGPYPAMPPGSPRRGLRTGIAIAAAVAVLAGIGGGVYALTANDGSGGGDQNNARPAPTRPGPQGQDGGGGQGGPDGGESGAPGQPRPPRTEDGYATDAISGISLPVPDGWTGKSEQVGASVSTGTYKCPGDTSKQCLRGGANSAPAVAWKIKATTAEAAAKEDISKNAEDSYGGTTYGKITSHDELASKAVTVAGQKGYMVRWKVVTSKGDDGYVESLAFPSPATPELLVVVRFGIDVDDKAPKQSVIDEITKGIKAAAGGGNGQNV
ncbi:DUF2510 domain-containing protein [Streptomyces sporangiiformans]|uniref:DUF2510 domain-containing protein n=1 Tax=Streptomyces sporangiiformans TaxID=2315329 RepID=A0A505DPQ9_9ACTN|nr:DUF2510 domain-containing protein [Streptomyces sporangiiformans]TPQ23264.1 DUF2510 domain-containing protein [Streptomyces sporangiiformans]